MSTATAALVLAPRSKSGHSQASFFEAYQSNRLSWWFHAAMQVGSTPSVAPSASSASSTSGTGFSTGLPTPTVSATAARRSRFGGASSRSLENLAALDTPGGELTAAHVNRDKRFSLFNSCRFSCLMMLGGSVCFDAGLHCSRGVWYCCLCNVGLGVHTCQMSRCHDP